jgi:hypothetical protein
LDTAERDHLFRVAGLLPPSDRNMPRHIPPSVQRLVARLGEVPLAVFTASWDLLAWSPLWAAVLGEPAEHPGLDRNIAVRTFGLNSDRHAEGSRARYVDDGESFRRSLVADLRRVSGRYPDDHQLAELIAFLRAGSAEFAELWASGVVGEHEAERKTIEHPVVGVLVVDCDVFSVAGTDLRIVAYTVAAGTPEADKLDFLRVAAAAGVAAPA